MSLEEAEDEDEEEESEKVADDDEDEEVERCLCLLSFKGRTGPYVFLGMQGALGIWHCKSFPIIGDCIDNS